MPKVSIIVPVYNVENYLSKCLDTLVAQTLDDYEIIVVNDGSPDNSQDIIDSYQAKYPDKIKAFTKKNGGLSDARNYGMKYATGEFIGFVDSDDYVDETMFEKLYNRAISTDSDVVICAHDAITLDRNNSIKNSVVHKVENFYEFGKSIYESPAILAYAKSYAWNKLYKYDVIKDYQFPKGQFFEDSAIVYNILSSAKKIEFVNEPLYHYIAGRTGAITTTIDNRIFDVFKSCDSLIEHYKNIGKFELLNEEIESLCLMHIHARFLQLKTKGSLNLKLKYVDTAFSYIEKNFPNWRNNKYYLTRRSAKLAAHPINSYDIARENCVSLKNYYILTYLQRLPDRIFKKIGEIINLLYKRLLNIPILDKSLEKSAKDLSEKELRELQLVTLDILKVVIEFCEEHNIRYYLTEGSLLGAVRHKGFIPWDDDLDIAMMRDDYERFLKLWGNNVHNECKLYHQSTYKKYYLPFAKVIFTGKCKFSSLIRTGLRSMNEVKGPGIDIFPLDETGPLSAELLKRASDIRKYRNILLTKVYYIKSPKKRRPYRLQCHLMSYKFLQNKIESLLTKDRGHGEEYITNFSSAYNITKEIFPKDYFEPARTVPFEDIMVTIPAKSEETLTRIYGDFMTPPPEEMRICPHQYIVKKK